MVLQGNADTRHENAMQRALLRQHQPSRSSSVGPALSHHAVQYMYAIRLCIFVGRLQQRAAPHLTACGAAGGCATCRSRTCAARSRCGTARTCRACRPGTETPARTADVSKAMSCGECRQLLYRALRPKQVPCNLLLAGCLDEKLKRAETKSIYKWGVLATACGAADYEQPAAPVHRSCKQQQLCRQAVPVAVL